MRCSTSCYCYIHISEYMLSLMLATVLELMDNDGEQERITLNVLSSSKTEWCKSL